MPIHSGAMAEFDWWLLIVGLVVGGSLTWLVLADTRRREVDVEDEELAREAVWLSEVMTKEGDPISAGTAEHVLHLHRAYLAAPPPDDPEEFGAAEGDPDVSSPETD
jgi:hypothetical protein